MNELKAALLLDRYISARDSVIKTTATSGNVVGHPNPRSVTQERMDGMIQEELRTRADVLKAMVKQ